VNSSNYRAVIRVIIKEMRVCQQQPAVSLVVADFEAAVWQAFRLVLPHIVMKGCAFRWCQAVWRRLQELGYQSAYNTDDKFHRYCRQLLALPFLPHEKVDSMERQKINNLFFPW